MKHVMDEKEARERFNALDIDTPDQILYGIPNGGKHVVAMAKHAKVTLDIREATALVDDIIDSGETRDRVLKMPELNGKCLPFYALVDKRNDLFDNTLGWIVFPWESVDDPEETSGLKIEPRIQAEYEQQEHQKTREDGTTAHPY